MECFLFDPTNVYILTNHITDHAYYQSTIYIFVATVRQKCKERIIYSNEVQKILESLQCLGAVNVI